MPSIKGIDLNGNDWALSLEAPNPRYPHRLDLKISFNQAEFVISRYTTQLQALETWSFIEKFCKPGTHFEKLERLNKKQKKEEENG